MNKFLLSACGLFALSTIAVAQDQVYLTSLNFAGSGCNPQDSSGRLFDVNHDGLPDQFEVIFSNYIAEQGPGVPLSLRRRNCNITVGMHLPQGYQFSIANVRYVGFADIPRGVTGKQMSTYEFPFYSNAVTMQSILNGPVSGGYSRQDNLGLTSVVWSPCGLQAPLNIRTDVFLTGVANIAASLTTDQVDGRVQQVYGLQWRTCH